MKTIEEIKEVFPHLSYNFDEIHLVGYYNPKDGTYSIQGTGETEFQAWHEAYDYLTSTGKYYPGWEDDLPNKSESGNRC